jgi:ubiquinone/menaquinone biosynthesis C-methylase UbiE
MLAVVLIVGETSAMGWLSRPRVPEPEVMDTDEEVDAYSSAAAQSYLESIDRTFVEHVARLIEPPGRTGGRALDFGCGPGQIQITMARRWPHMRFTGLDAGPNMIEKARLDAAEAGVETEFEVLRLGPHGEPSLPFPDAEFDLVTCNSVLHHLDDPAGTLNELARVAKPDGAVLLRDLVRPPGFTYPLHVRFFGRNYSGEMRRLFEASVRAAYTTGELKLMLRDSALNDGRTRVFRRGLTHTGIERPALERTERAWWTV